MFKFIGMSTGLKITLALLLLFATMRSQSDPIKTNTTLIQFSGVVLDQDSLTPIPFVSIIIKGTNRGSLTNFNGFFSLILSPGDELEFHSVSHKDRTYKIADTL